MKMINVGPMRIPADQLPTLAKILGATITTWVSLKPGDIIQENDEMYYPDDDDWVRVSEIIVGMGYTEIMDKVRRKEPEFRCCVEHTGCGDMVNCPYDFQELFSHLAPGESQTVVCEAIEDLVCIHRTLAREKERT